ncbi:MAG: hypothetical protein ACHQPI_13455 [Thermoanaerobaculia bacterium]
MWSDAVSQINFHVTEGFQKDLRRFMRARGIPTKSAAIRTAVHEGSERTASAKDADFRAWVGLGNRGPARRRRLASHDELWR